MLSILLELMGFSKVDTRTVWWVESTSECTGRCTGRYTDLRNISWTTIRGSPFRCLLMGCSLGLGLNTSLGVSLPLRSGSRWLNSSRSIHLAVSWFLQCSEFQRQLLECRYSIQVYFPDWMLVGSNAEFEGWLARSNEGLPQPYSSGLHLTQWGPSLPAQRAQQVQPGTHHFEQL